MTSDEKLLIALDKKLLNFSADGDYTSVEWALFAGADVFAKRNGKTPRQLAAENGYTEVANRLEREEQRVRGLEQAEHGQSRHAARAAERRPITRRAPPIAKSNAACVSRALIA